MNRRSFFGFGAKVIGAATLGAHFVLYKVGAQFGLDEAAHGKPIINWQVTYNNDRHETFKGEPGFVIKYGPVVTKTMSLPRGIYPPLNTTWAGRSYTRYYISPMGHSVVYRQA
jgi:hypothetical protein